MSTVLDDSQAKQHIAANVARLLDEQGKSRYWLAKETGEWQSRIANVLNGENLCSAGLLARIAEALGVGADDLLEPPGPKRRKLEKSA